MMSKLAHLSAEEKKRRRNDMKNAAAKRRYYADIERARAKARNEYHAKVERSRENARGRYQKNRKKEISRSTEYRNTNKDKVNAYRRQRSAIQRQDPMKRVLAVLRSRISNAMARGANRPGSAVRDLGCTYEELRKYLEDMFEPGMTWENYGRHGWHIDHIIPLAFFDLSNREQFLNAVHWTNLQPKWWLANVKKGAKIEPPILW